MQSSLRRRPNCFNLLHQLQFLLRSGLTQEATDKTLEARKVFVGVWVPELGSQFSIYVPSYKAQESVASFATAFNLGKAESAAALNLLHEVHAEVKDALTELVRYLI